jgi:hypothetical protein
MQLPIGRLCEIKRAAAGQHHKEDGGEQDSEVR